MNETTLSVSQVATKPVGKVRNPWMIILLIPVTLGIYGVVWYYSIVEELKNWRGQGWSGMMFIFLLFFFGIALIALPWLIPAYIGRMYEEDGQKKPITGLAGFWQFIPIIGLFVWVFKVQNNLNRFWKQKSAITENKLESTTTKQRTGAELEKDQTVDKNSDGSGERIPLTV